MLIFVQQLVEVTTIGAFREPASFACDLICSDPTVMVSNFLRACDLQPLPLLQALDEVRSFDETVVSPSIEPSVAPPEPLDAELAFAQVSGIDIGYFKLSSSGWA